MIEHVYLRAKMYHGWDKLYLATCDREIEDFANLQGYKPDTLENFRKGAAATKFTTPNGKQRRTASTVIDTAYAKINKAWGNKTDSKRKIVFKYQDIPQKGSSSVWAYFKEMVVLRLFYLKIIKLHI